MRTIRFTIPGRPVPKPRMTRSDKWKKRPCVLRYRAFADLARASGGDLPDPNTIMEVRCVAYFKPTRKSLDGQRHRQKPDSSNLLKAVEDALFREDSALADVVARKRWGLPERVEVEIDYLPAGGGELACAA